MEALVSLGMGVPQVKHRLHTKHKLRLGSCESVLLQGQHMNYELMVIAAM